MPTQNNTTQNTTMKRFSRFQATSLKPVGQVLRPVIKSVLPQTSVVFQQVFELWPDIVHGTEAMGTIPEKLVFARKEQKGGCLHLWVQTSAQAMELTYNKKTLLYRLNSFFGYSLVGDIKVTAHPGKGKKAPANPIKVKQGRGVSCQSLDKILGGISNPSLKEVLGELGGCLDAETIETTQKGETDA
jgi:hypothetical protein